MKDRRKGVATGPFVLHRLEMRQSPAWRALPDNARRLLDRLELEHMQHAGSENGRLVCPYADFVRAGLRRASIPLAIRQAVALGFLAVEEKGHRTSREFYAASRYRLTYLAPRKNRGPEATDDWAKIETDDQARAALAAIPDREKRPMAAPMRRLAA